MTDRPVLYLDFDGVLHHEDVRVFRKRGIVCAEGELFEHAPALEVLLEPHPDVRIVLSTSWVPMHRYSGARKRLSKALQARVIGATYHTGMGRELWFALPRGQQVLGDVRRRGVTRWVAVDDDDGGWPDSVRDRVVLTDGERGLGDPDAVERLREALARLATGRFRETP